MLQNVPGFSLFLRNTKQHNHLSYISLKIAPLCKHTLLPAKLLEAFLEAILWKHFQLFRRILNKITSVTKAPFLQCWLQSRDQLKPGQKVMGDVPVLSHFFCYEILDQNRLVCWNTVVKEIQNVGSVFCVTSTPWSTQKRNELRAIEELDREERKTSICYSVPMYRTLSLLVRVATETKPIPMAAQSKAWVCFRSLVGIVGSNPSGGIHVCLL